MELLEGIDTSNVNGHPSVYGNSWWYQQAQFVIAQAIPFGPASTAEQLYYGRDHGKLLGVYSWIWEDPSWRRHPDMRQDQRIRWATIPEDIELHGRPFIDTEDNLSPIGLGNGNRPSNSLRERKDNLLVALDEADTLANKRHLPPGGIYTSPYYIDRQYDGWMPEGRVIWLAHYGRTRASVIGGNVVGHQYTSSPIDRDAFLASEFIHHQEAGAISMSLQINQGLSDAITGNQDHPISDEFTFRVNGDGTVIQAAYGLKGRYISTNAGTGDANVWEAAGPFNA
jgi:hypothetical protein